MGQTKLTLCNIEQPQLGVCTRVLEELQTVARTSELVKRDTVATYWGVQLFAVGVSNDI